ncbi:MAG: glycosyltransferase family 2 protein, partial [archaeon GBS-70-058]|nr:glycosyltransferase family 2 protein [Candidatus Culexarchaeum nevadense]
MKPTIIACIPAYNEERTIARVVVEAQRYVDKVIVCDDGSTDLTGEIARRLGAEVIKHEKNMGKGTALRDLFKAAKKYNPNIIVTIDADGQHNPNDIPILLEPIERGEADFVIGSRFVEGAKTDAPFYRKFGLKIINFLGKATTKSDIKDTQSGFRALTIKALNELLNIESEGFGVESEQITLALKRGLRIKEVPVTIKYRGLPKTSKKPSLFHGGEIIATMLKLVVEERPLLYLGLPGAILILLAITLGTYLLLLFNATRYFSLPIAIITLGASLSGITLIVAALMLYATNRITKKV